MSRYLILLLCIWFGSASSSTSQAQSTGAEGLLFQSLTRGYHSRVDPGGTIMLHANVENRSEENRRGRVVLTVDGEIDEQSARVFDLRGGTSEILDVYLQLPPTIAGNRMVDITARIYVQAGGREVMLDRRGKPVEHTLRLAVDYQPNLAAFIMDDEPPAFPTWQWPPQRPYESYEMSVASRIDTGLTREAASYDVTTLPLFDADWQIADVTFVADERCFDDAAGVESLRRYLAGGGKMWITLDRIPAERIAGLLGVEQSIVEIDEVELNSALVEVHDATQQLSEEDRTINSEIPMRMKRVVQSGGRVSHTVDGWPIAIRMQVGLGELLITTLECGAWITPRLNPAEDALHYAAFETRVWGNKLALEINDKRRSLPLMNDVNYPLKHIGNPVVPHAWITMALVGFCGLLAASGLWLWISTRPTALIAVAPALALLTGFGIYAMSSWVRRDIPESHARLQFIQVADDGRTALVREQSAVYLSNESDMALESQVDGLAMADPSLVSGLRQLEVLDFQKWRYRSDSWPAGTWRYRSRYALTTENQAVARATLDAAGISVTLPELPSPLEDPVLSFVKGAPMLCEADENRLQTDGSQNASSGRWIQGTIISDEQQRRLEVYQNHFDPQHKASLPDRALYGWTDIWPGGPTWTADLEERGAALVSLPILLERPAVGTEVLIPHGLIQLRRDPNGMGRTAAFDELSGSWVPELTMAATAEMQLVLPGEVTPLDAESIELSIDIKAPKRGVRLSAVAEDGTPVEIVSLENPSIPWTGTVTDPRILNAIKDGQLSVVLEVSARKDVERGQSTMSVVTWEVDHLRATVRGAVASRSAGITAN